MADYNIKFDWNKISTLGKVRILVEQVVGSPSQAQINAAVASYIDSHPGSLSPLSQATKSALLDIAAHVAYIDANGQSYYNALDAALNAKALLSITAVYTQSGTVYDTDSLDSLKSDLVVTAYYDDGTSADVTSASVLSGTLTEGTSTVTVTFSGKSATFEVTVSAETILYPLENVPRTPISVYDNTGYITITNGNHVKIEAETIAKQSDGLTFNVTSHLTNGNTMNNLPTAFTLPADVPIVFKYSNFVGDTFSKQLNTRKARTSTSGSFGTGVKTSLADITVSKTLTTAENVGCVFGYFQPAAGQSVEFDVSLTVDGERWI